MGPKGGRPHQHQPRPEPRAEGEDLRVRWPLHGVRGEVRRGDADKRTVQCRSLVSRLVMLEQYIPTNFLDRRACSASCYVTCARGKFAQAVGAPATRFVWSSPRTPGSTYCCIDWVVAASSNFLYIYILTRRFASSFPADS